jgi:ABC-type branched-subunit amino acid transport system substrate-binding protein
MNVKETLEKLSAWPFVHIATSKGETYIDMQAWEDQVWQESRRQAFREAIEICESLEINNPHGLMEEDSHNGTITQCIEAIQQHMEKP